MKAAYLLIDARGPEIQYRSGLTASDPFIYLAPDDEAPVVFFDAREYGVQKQKLDQLKNGVRIEYLEPSMKKVSQAGPDPLIDALLVILKEFGISELRVSGSLPYAVGQYLVEAGFKVVVYDYAKERERKTGVEIGHLITAQRVNESAFVVARQILADSTIRGEALVYNGRTLTSEFMKSTLKKHLLDHGYECPDGIIVASGEQSTRPHDEGSGRLLPNSCIIIDIFPRSEKTGYFADMTRTFVKGEPSAEIKKLFSAVEVVQREVIKNILIGDICSVVHQRTIELFRELGYETSHEKGFMHGTGHSLGLSVHENPRLNAHSKRTIEPGMIFTIEPGLYYPGIGGVRLEDIVVFHPDGRKENITKFEKPYFIS